MTALQPPMNEEPQLDLGSLPQTFDLSSIDRRLNTVSSIDSTWNLPSLPHEVKLDLASRQDTPDDGLVGLLWGLANDISKALVPPAAAAEADITQPSDALAPFDPADAFDQNPFSTENRIRRQVAGWAGLRAPRIYSDLAVEQWKRRAIKQGLLSADTPIDGAWSPEFNSLAAEMSSQDFEDRLGGDRPGALSIGNIAEQIGKWVTPSGLLRAATELDFLPDFKEIGNEISSMEDKWNKVFDHPTSPRNWIDALTGPIDDVVVPILNDALLVAGVGEAIGFVRGVQLSAKTAEGLYLGAEAAKSINTGVRLTEGVGRFSRLGKAYNLSEDLAHFTKPGIFARRFQRTEALAGLGNTMAAWRGLKPVAVGKKVIQTGMRLGIASNVENLLLPSRDGLSIGDLARSTGIDDWRGMRTINPLVGGAGWIVDLAMTPPSIFGEGAIKGAYMAATSPVRQAVAKLPLEARAASVLSKAMRSHAQALLDHAAAGGEVDEAFLGRAQKFVQDMAEHGPSRALVEHFGDEETAGGFLLWLMHSAAIDGAARAKANKYFSSAVKNGSWAEHYYAWRDKYIAQLRHIPDEGIDEYLRTRAGMPEVQPDGSVKLPKRFVQDTRVESLRSGLESADDAIRMGAEDARRAWITAHNGNRQGTWNELLDELTDEHLAAYAPQMMERIWHWDQFVDLSHEVRRFMQEGLLDGVKFERYASNISTRSDDVWKAIQEGITPEDAQKIHLNPHSKAPKRQVGRFTLAREDFVTKQEKRMVLTFARRLIGLEKTTNRMLNDPEWMDAYWALADRAAEEGTTLSDAGAHVIRTWMDEIAGDDLTHVFRTKKQRGAFTALLNWARTNEVGLTDAQRLLRQDLDDLANSPMWSERFNIAFDTGALDDKLRHLENTIKFTASEVTDLPDDLARLLDGSGYKLVHGYEYAAPDDLLGLGVPAAKGQGSVAGALDDVSSGFDVPDTAERALAWAPGIAPFPELTERWSRMRSLGTFFQRQEPGAVTALRDRSFRAAVSDRLGQLRSPQLEALDLTPDGADMERILRRVKDIFFRRQEASAAALLEGEKSGAFARALNRTEQAVDAPFSMQKLRQKWILDEFTDEFGKDGALAIYHALKDSNRVNSFSTRGLLSIEDHLVSRPWFLGQLATLGGSPIAKPLLADARRGTRIAAGAALGALSSAAVAEGAGQDPSLGMVVGGAVGGAVLGPNRSFNVAKRLAAGAAGAAVTEALPGQQSDLETLGGALIGAVVGPKQVTRLMTKTLTRHPEWIKYSYMGDGLTSLRDNLRFTLSPFFDMRRYTKGVVLAATDPHLGDHTLPLLTSRRSFIKKFGEAEWARAEAGLTAQLKSMGEAIDLEAIEPTMRWVKQQGMLGYSTQNFMTAAFGYLTKQGMDTVEAAKAAKGIYTYGITGRSAAELSVNFLFFPFSFEKKLVGNVTRFMAQDLSRAAFLHDMLKTYEILNERFDLSDYWEEHLPVLHQLEKMNAFAHGISPGELGGMNRPLMDFFLNIPPGDKAAAVLNVFLPQGLKISTREESEAFMKLWSRAMPVVNDVRRLMDDLYEQGNVFMDPNHITRAASIERGWAKHNETKLAFDNVLKENGFEGGLQDMLRSRDPALMQVKDIYKAEKAKIAKEYPDWADSLAAAVAQRVKDENELTNRIALFAEQAPEVNGLVDAADQLVLNQAAIAALAERTDTVEMDLLEFYLIERQVKALMRQAGLSTSEFEDLPPEIFDGVRADALRLVARGNGFEKEYRRYFRRNWGPIEQDLY